MFNHRWSCGGSLDEICRELNACRFHPKVFLIISRGPGWYRIDCNTWLMLKDDDNGWQLYFWSNCDPRPSIYGLTRMKGFK